MDRINGLNTVDIGAGRRGFRKKNKAAGLAGTEVTEIHMNALQEELLYCIEQSGQIPAINDWTQLWKAVGARFGGLRVLVAPTTFYVNGASGNDANDGLTAGTAFATLQGAVDKISSSYIAMQAVTVQVAEGIYGGVTFPSSLISSWQLLGFPTAPAAVTIDATVLASNRGRAIAASRGVTLTLNGLTFSAYYESVTSGGATVIMRGWNRLIGNAASAMLSAYSGGNLFLSGAITIEAGGYNGFLAAGTGGNVGLGYQDASGTTPLAVTLIGTPSFNVVAYAENAGAMNAYPAVVTFTGAATGQRYIANTNGIINSRGGGANFFPGSTAGFTASGGQYA